MMEIQSLVDDSLVFSWRFTVSDMIIIYDVKNQKYGDTIDDY